MCFQIVDDVLDLTATEETLGKPAGQDLLEGVYTLPVIYALRDQPELRDLLGRPLDRRRARRRPTARRRATARSTPRSRSPARTRARPCDALDGADGLDARVCSSLTALVDRQVTRLY